MSPLTGNVQSRPIHRHREWVLVAKEERNMGSDYLTSVGFSFQVRKMFWNWIKVTIYNSVNVLKTTELSPLKG